MLTNNIVHQCRWGYENWTVLENVVETYEKFGIPLEHIWTYVKPNGAFAEQCSSRVLPDVFDSHVLTEGLAVT